MALQISAEQYQALQQQGERRFIERAAAFLRAEFPDTAGRAAADKLDAAIRFGMARAAGHGFETERHIVDFLCLMFRLGPRFDEDPALASLRPPLRDLPGTPPAVRMAFLLDAAAELGSARRPDAP
jgi:hypothetical protein